MAMNMFHVYILAFIIMFAQFLIIMMPIDFSANDNNTKPVINIHAYAQKETSSHDSKEIHDNEKHEQKDKSHVHASLSAEIAQWVGVGTMAGLSMAALRMRVRGKIVLRNIVLLLSVGAGVMHVLLAPDHLDVGIEHAGFFVVAGLSQIGFGIIFMLKPSRIMSVIGIIGNGGNIILYFVTRIKDFPIPFAAPEGIDAIGIIAKIIEISLVIFLLFLIRRK